MQLVIHCGAHKTGTSSIQSLLFEQRHELLKQGVLYISETQLNRSGILQYLHRSSATISTRNSIRTKIERILDKHRPEKVIVSHESIFSFVDIDQGSGDFYGSAPQSLRNLEFLGLDEIFSAIRAVLYVRRQDEFLQSLYMQNLSTGKWTNSFEQALDNIDCTNISWLSYAIKLANFFGESNVMIRPFETINDGWKNLIKDFCMATTIDVHDSLSEKKVNESFSTPAYLAALALMPLIHKTKARLRVAQTLKQALPPSIFGKATPLSDAVRLRILRELEKDNRELFTTFIKDYPEDFYAPNQV
ncbi:MAG: hypothetical protein ACR2P1_28615 [Pseudomonadales bacterium]